MITCSRWSLQRLTILTLRGKQRKGPLCRIRLPSCMLRAKQWTIQLWTFQQQAWCQLTPTSLGCSFPVPEKWLLKLRLCFRYKLFLLLSSWTILYNWCFIHTVQTLQDVLLLYREFPLFEPPFCHFQALIQRLQSPAPFPQWHLNHLLAPANFFVRLFLSGFSRWIRSEILSSFALSLPW